MSAQALLSGPLFSHVCEGLLPSVRARSHSPVFREPCVARWSTRKAHESSCISREFKQGRVLVSAAATPKDVDHSSYMPDSVLVSRDVPSISSISSFIDAFVRFSRPHTMIGTALSICSVSLLAIDSQADLNLAFALGIIQALLPALLMNIYIVGLNQLCDIDIDKVNKPYLPLASGEFSVPQGLFIVAASVVMSLGIGLAVGSQPLLWTLVVSMVLGTAYSLDLPLLRWKRFPILAAGCILAVRAFVVQLGFFSHMKEFVFGRAIRLSPPLIFATSFMCLFSVVIALFKDIPDVKGDRVYGIMSLSVRLGQKTVFWSCVGILLAAYGGAVGVALASKVMWNKFLGIGSHVLAAILLLRTAGKTNLNSAKAISETYMFVWKLFYAEYLLLPFLK
eukprot:TRINITY_DN4272_c0_g1_i1.p1 TRINITY_DN4272_c0_g1~~TRINITY_DN4272_c0_g1_i1.p1  ORF type:complete len:394 (-),score=0.35 TRINITY_DN4272_c0_g1_i1:399-1580(-)